MLKMKGEDNMFKGKKLLVVFLIIVGVVLLPLINFSEAEVSASEKLKVGATPVPHAEILEHIKDELADVGVDIEIVEFTDYVTPNLALADGSIDANFFQHVPYLDQFKEDRGLDLTYTKKVHIEPYGLYSEKVSKVKDLPKGAVIALPNDPSNEARALQILHRKGLIELNDPENLKATPLDIVDNPKNFEFKELEAAQLPRVLGDVDAAFINTNYALEANFNPVEDALLIEDKESPYANVLAVREGEEDNYGIRMLSKFLTGRKVKDFIEKNYGGSIVPAF